VKLIKYHLLKVEFSQLADIYEFTKEFQVNMGKKLNVVNNKCYLNKKVKSSLSLHKLNIIKSLLGGSTTD
jgi:hypothetical protein